MATTENVDFLSRCSIEPGRATLRFYDYGWRPDADALPVLVVTITEPAFDESAVADFLATEVHVSVLTNGLEIWRDDDATTAQLLGESVTTAWAPYDIEDLKQRLDQMNTAYEDAYARHAEGLRTIDTAVSLGEELIRRATAKAQLSADMAARQAEAIRVLERMLVVLGAKP